MAPHKRPENAVYSIGAVSNLTGLSPNTLRTWERRYQAVEPARTQRGGRRYRDKDVERIQLLVELTRAGEAISVLAPLPTETLQTRVAQHRSQAPEQVGELQIAVLHTSLAARLAALPPDGFWISSAAQTPDELVEQVMNRPRVDVLVLELALLGPEPEATVERLFEASGAREAVIEYVFTRRDVLEALVQQGARVLRGPATTDELLQSIRFHARTPTTRTAEPPIKPRRFTPAQLAALRELHPELDCECPTHVATLVSALSSFEDYSATCAREQPADATLHEALARATGRARTLMESMLARVCEHDGIEL